VSSKTSWLVVAMLGARATRPSPQAPASSDLASLARAVAATWMRDQPPEQLAWSWGEGVLAYGMWSLHARLGDASLRAYLTTYVTRHQAREVRITWSDDTTPGLTAAELVLAGDTQLRPVLDRVVAYAMTAPRTEAQGLVRHLGRHIPVWITPRAWFPDAWVDSLFHFPITLCRYSVIRGDERYRDEAASQVLKFLRNLQDPATGFVTHAYNDRPRDEHVPAFAQRAFWARGNGWALVSTVEVWRALPTDHPMRAELGERARRLASALRTVQSADGLFHTVLLDSASYTETAASGLLTYAFALGARSGLLDPTFRVPAELGMRGLVGTLQQRGERLEVSGTSVGTNPSSTARGYARIGRAKQVSYGVGAWLLAASALL
jgi:rhamnogalacturonyl hydrolase YesR